MAFSYKIPSQPSKNRVYIWRMLKDLGAVYLQQGVALLPNCSSLYTVFVSLREQVISMGGKSTLSKLVFDKEEDESDIIEEFLLQIDEEFNELIVNCNLAMDEIERDIKDNEFSFSEITEKEEDYAKFQRWYDKIEKKNYFKSSQTDKAYDILAKMKVRIEYYANEVYKIEDNNFLNVDDSSS